MTASNEHDVVIVGGGGSGLACAVAAASAGASVLVLEKRPYPGGTTGIAIGSFTANGSEFQRRAGIADNPDDHEADAARFGTPELQQRNHGPLRRSFLGETAATLQWLTSLGLAFHGPSPEPPNRVPRMHNVVPNAKSYIATFQAQLMRMGGTLLCDAIVDELLRDDFRVLGVAASVAGQRRTFHARLGVVLAAGDYANSPEMIARFKGSRFAAIEGINPHATGDGHRLAEQAGALMINMDITYGPELRFVPGSQRGFEQLLPARGPLLSVLARLLPWVPRAIMQRLIKRLLVTWQHPENALFDDGAILLNAAGMRFCNECQSPDREIAVANQPEKHAYLLLDQWLIERYSAWPHFISTAPEIAYAYVSDYLRLRPDVAVRGEFLATVAAARGLPVDVVQQSVRQFNECITTSRTDVFGRTGMARGLNGNQWVLLGPVKAYFTTTEGGAAINDQMQVLDENERPIPGLFAVGQNGLGGMILWGHGLHIAWALTSGRLVGEALGRKASGAASAHR